MQFLRIASPGVADPMALTILGVGTSRYSGRGDVIGQFSSGSKLAAGLLLRNNLPPVIIPGNLRMTYGIRPIVVDGHDFQQVMVKYSGTDVDGKSRTSTEDLGYTLEWGVADWDDVTMAPREYVANAIDAVLKQGLGLDAVEIGLTDGIRAKKGWTQVYIPANEDIVRFYKELNLRFLHFGRKDLLEQKMLPKLVPGEENKTRIYKKGVLVKTLEEPSVFDYNLGDELRLDESRNAGHWDVRYAVAKALAHATAGDLAKIIKAVATADNRAALVESSLDASYLEDKYSDENREERKTEWQDAFKRVAGEDGVASTGLTGVASHIRGKGKEAFVLPSNWVKVLGEMDAPTEDRILSASEKAGEVLSEPTADMVKAVDDVWDLLKLYDMTNDKEKPPVKAFMSIMDAGTQRRGEYRDGTVLLHVDMGSMSPLLRKVALEEVAHHVTGAGDMSRDLQDFMFRLVSVIAW